MRRWLVLGLVAILVFAIGMAIGRKSGPATTGVPAQTVTVAATTVSRSAAAPGVKAKAAYSRTQDGAVAAAVRYLGALSGEVILDPASARRAVSGIAARRSREALSRAYAAAAIQLREELGIETVPKPVVLVRAAPVGYRISGFTSTTATVSVWRVGIVGSGATADPRQSWRTETVSLVWEDGTWKVASLRSTPGPTPPLGARATPPAQLFASIPEFAEFDNEP